MLKLRHRLLFLLTTFLSNYGITCAQDYTQYHRSITRAEKQIFVDGKIKDGITTYATTFRQYDFVFLHDCFTALQIALHANDEKHFLYFTDKATQNGLMIRHMDKVGYIKKHHLFVKNKNVIDSLYKANRPGYLKRIDTAALKKMYALYAYDQMNKVAIPGESVPAHLRRYKQQVKVTMDSLRALIARKGWPSDKLLDIPQADIMRELRVRHNDMMDYYRKDRNEHAIGSDQFEIAEHYFSSTFFFPIMHHYGTKYSLKFYDDSFYLQQIKAGNLHPKDVGALNDIAFDFGERKPVLEKADRYFGVGIRTGPAFDGIPLAIPDEKINEFRKKFFIGPIETGRAKWRFMKEKGMYFGWGDHGSRS